jgi:serine/threonine protein kinase
MPLQHGGLALKNKDQFEGTTDTEKYAKAFTYMIQNATEIKCISYNSLAGYIFIIKIAPNDAVFLNLDSDKKYTIPVTNVLVKFALITPNKMNYANAIDNENKITTIKQDFEKEKNIQLDIYKKTLESNNIPICPSIIYYDVIPNKPDSEILTIFNNKIKEKTEYARKMDTNNSKDPHISTNLREMIITQKVIEEILKYKNKLSIVEVGIIGMEYANGYTTFDNYLDNIKKDQRHIKGIYNSLECGKHCICIANIIINIIRLFISTGIIHMDLHVNNIMVNLEEQKSLLIDFGFYKKIVDTKQCNEDINVSNNSIIYKRVIKQKGRLYGVINEYINSVDAIIKYLKLQLGESYDYITNEQRFMQTYLFGMSDEIRIKKIIKLFILIIMCDLNLNNIRLGRPIIMMYDFLVFLGLKIKSGADGHIDIFSSKYITDIDNNTKSLDDWISENIKEETTFKYKIFFKKIFTEVLTKIKQMYWINDDSIIRIGYTPKIHEDLKQTSSVFTFGKGGNQTKYKRKRNSKKKNHKRTKKNV